MQLALKDPRRSAPRPRRPGSVAPAPQLPPVLTLYNPEGLHFLARGEVPGGVTSPLTFPPRGTVTTHTAPRGQFPKQSPQCRAATVSPQDCSVPGGVTGTTVPADPHPEPAEQAHPAQGPAQSPLVTSSAPWGQGTRWPGTGEGVLTRLQLQSSSIVAIPIPGAREGGHGLGNW